MFVIGCAQTPIVEIVPMQIKKNGTINTILMIGENNLKSVKPFIMLLILKKIVLEEWHKCMQGERLWVNK